MSVSAATAESKKLRAAPASGIDAATVKKQAAADARAAAEEKRRSEKTVQLTVSRLCLDYFDGRIERHRKTKGAAVVRRIFDTMLGDFGDLPVEAVTRSSAFNLLDSHLHIPVQCLRLRAELGAAWDYGLDAGRLPETVPNWWRLILRGKILSKGRMVKGKFAGTSKRVLSATEVGTLIRSLPNFTRVIEDALTL